MDEDKVTSYAHRLERDGYVVIESFFPISDVIKAHDEICNAYESDLLAREQHKIDDGLFDGPTGRSILTKPTHLLLDVYGKCPTLDLLFEKILTNDFSSQLLKRLAGPQLKLRGYNCQKLTGAMDKAPAVGPAPNPHEWHRDSPGEICISIFLTDLAGPNQGATSLVPGSHLYPYCPRWNCLFGPPHRIKMGLEIAGNFFLKVNFFNKILGKLVKKNATGAYGHRGDFYIFINDTWHGREPNTSGQSGIKFMVGAFPIDAPFPDSVTPPTGQVLTSLPPALRQAASQKGPIEPGADTILNRIKARQKEPKRPIFRLAQLERQFADKLAERYQ